MESGKHSLPDDLVFRILIWLPVMSLLRFKSVCKTWLDLIESSTFIAQHLHLRHNHHHFTSSSESDNLLVASYRHKGKFRYLLLSGRDEFDVPINLDLEQEDSVFNKRPGLVGSCNGIICLYSGDQVALWNPATKQSKILPEEPFPVGDNHKAVWFGFGFDVKTNDYKVVRASGDWDNYNISTKTNTFLVYVYKLSTDSWRLIGDAVLPVEDFWPFVAVVHQNKFYCWLGYNNSSQLTLYIVRFDFADEVMDFMALPDSVDHEKCSWSLVSVGENIACFNIPGPGTVDKLFEVWVLYEFGVMESWAKLYTISCPIFSSPQGFTTNEEFFVVSDDENLFFCNPVIPKIKRVNLNVKRCGMIQVVFYKESLVSIRERNEVANVD